MNTFTQDSQAGGVVPAPHIVIVGGTTRANSTSERLARSCEVLLRALGATTRMFPAADLEFPMYAPERQTQHAGARDFVEEVRRCHGVVIATPSYHGGISGLLKNALDYTEDLRDDARPYLDGRGVGLIATGAGWQGANTALAGLRSCVHALRGWPTPLGIAVNSTQPLFDAAGNPNRDIENNLKIMAGQVFELSRSMAREQRMRMSAELAATGGSAI